MKKLSCLLLLLMMLAQLLLIPAGATTVDEAGLTTEGSNQGVMAIEDTGVEFGMNTILNGCRTLEGQSPLGGSDRMLLSAQAAFVYEINTDTILYAYNPDQRLAPGSLSKMLTALIAIEECDLNDVITVSTREISKLPYGFKKCRMSTAALFYKFHQISVINCLSNQSQFCK